MPAAPGTRIYVIEDLRDVTSDMMQGITARVTEREQAGRTIYRVRLGPYNSKADADSARSRLENAGVTAALVRVQR